MTSNQNFARRQSPTTALALINRLNVTTLATSPSSSMTKKCLSALSTSQFMAYMWMAMFTASTRASAVPPSRRKASTKLV
eukprot:CAMPEP_0170313372 /NCGR_PEP_ID=MMETSP0116_2-20130129/57235_1 /TAXON_ID=400756 /ORGANISM="Durinskia baltica, Strain CSIRO CS-38" /LENGTH=79 /DNA_ID=CAMNT_0010565773 /DNA_START=153 /DNA_END=388 /DNA_ORIENTATION=+